MNCRTIPTLKDIGLTKVALLLYNDQEIKQLSECAQHDSQEWNQILNDKVSKLFLPTEVSDELSAIIKRVYLLLTKFYALHQHFSIFLCDQCECLKGILKSCHFWKFWTTETFFSEQKIAECLIGDQSLSDAFRFILVCEYFVEDDAHSQWQQLLHLVRNRLFNDDIPERIKQRARTIMPEEFSELRRLSKMVLENFVGQ
ncbi:hypothetical protein AVEN_36778-1 [Araneus ventricosus]|uniref:Uncharacterized protein n=1 Tax=Araneus ventricosus TaxID=182803 RepID=A0A4Y2KP05_ARAVE|nr:hypothetical protein AVEN_36778-1 [Araneus ventricosus]